MDLESLVVKIIGEASSFDSVITETQKKITNTTTQLKNSARQIEAAQRQLAAEGARLTAQLATPWEKFSASMEQVNELYKNGAISAAIFARAQEKVQKEFEATLPSSQALARAEKARLEATERSQAILNEQMKAGARITAEVRTPVEQYRNSLSGLDELLRVGAISTETYDRKLRQLKTTLPVNVAATEAAKKATQEAEKATREAERAQERINVAFQKGADLASTLVGPLKGYQVTLNGLNKQLKEGAISAEVYEKRLTSLARASANTLQQHQALQAKALGITREHHTSEQAFYARKNELGVLAPFLTSQMQNKLAADNARILRENTLALKTAGKAEGTAAEARKLHNDYIARANQLIEHGKTQRQKYIQDLGDLNRLYKAGYIGVKDYANSLRALNSQNQFLLQSLNKTAFQLRVISSGLSRFGAGLRTVGAMGSLFVTAPLTAFAAAGVHELMAFDKAMTYSLSIAENVTPQLRKQMEDLATTLSEKTAHSATELAQAYYELISAGLDAKTSMLSLATVSKFAIAGGMELASSVKHLAKATAAMGLAGKTAQETAAGMYRVANVLVQAANMTTGSIEDMTQALVNGAAPQAKILNMQLEDTVAVLMHYVQVGESAATSSEHFAIGMRLLGTAYSEHKDFWKQQGLSLYTAQGQMKKFTDVLRDMQKIYLNLTAEGKVPFLKALGFQALQQRALNPLLADPKAADQIDEWSKKLQRAGALEEVAAKQMESLSNQFKVFRNMLANVAREIGLILMPYLQKGIAIVKTTIEYWKGLNEEGKRLIIVGAAIAVSIGPLIAALGTAATLTAAAVGGISALVTAIVAVGLPVAAAAAGFMILASAIAAIGAYSIAIELWPEETQKVMRVLERMWNAFEGFMATLFDKIFTVDMVKAFLKGSLGLLAKIDPMADLWRRALFGEDVKEDAKKFADKTANEIQDALDRAGGALDLGSRLSIILKEELGGEGLSNKLKKAVDDAEILTKAQTAFSEMQKMAGSTQGTNPFSTLSEKLNEVNDRFKEMLALEQEQARMGYEKIDKMTSAEKELLKVELQIADERQAIADRFDKQMRNQMLFGNIDFLHPEKTKAQALKEYDQQNEAVLKELRSRAALASTLERERLRRQELQAIIDRDPAKKIAKQIKDLQDAYATGDMGLQHYRKELAALRAEMAKEFKIDFKIGGIEAMKHGTAQTKAAIEQFIMMQQEALRPLPTPEQLMSGHLPPAPKLPGYGAGKPKANPFLNPGMNAEMERLAGLANTSGPIAAEARRKLRQMGMSPAQLKGTQFRRLLELSKQGGLIGADARRRLSESHDISASSFAGDEVSRLQGLAEKGGRMGFFAKQKLKQMGASLTASRVTATSAASRNIENTKAQDTERSLLKEIAQNTAKTAKKKEVVVEPANL